MSAIAHHIRLSWNKCSSKEPLDNDIPYPRDAWADFCPIIIFVHFENWAIQNSNILLVENVGGTHILISEPFEKLGKNSA
jgi:hypothetical protein